MLWYVSHSSCSHCVLYFLKRETIPVVKADTNISSTRKNKIKHFTYWGSWTQLTWTNLRPFSLPPHVKDTTVDSTDPFIRSKSLTSIGYRFTIFITLAAPITRCRSWKFRNFMISTQGYFCSVAGLLGSLPIWCARSVITGLASDTPNTSGSHSSRNLTAFLPSAYSPNPLFWSWAARLGSPKFALFFAYHWCYLLYC